MEEVPQEIIRAAGKLNYTQLFSIGIGVDSEMISDKHWLYFPETKYLFNRVSFPMNLSESTTPKGKSSALAEVTFKPDQSIDVDECVGSVIMGLTDTEIIKPNSKIDVVDCREFKYGYVIHDLDRRKNVELIHEYLKDCMIMPAGRWGKWKYFNLDKTIQSGREAAVKINNS
jgi:UDP-galactopyranose mutase